MIPSYLKHRDGQRAPPLVEVNQAILVWSLPTSVVDPDTDPSPASQVIPDPGFDDHMKCLNFVLLLWVIFSLLDPDLDSESGYGSTDLIESGSNPDPKTLLATCPRCLTFSMEVGSMSGEVILFSTARMTPSSVWMPMAVEPSLIASMAYSTWQMDTVLFVYGLHDLWGHNQGCGSGFALFWKLYPDPVPHLSQN